MMASPLGQPRRDAAIAAKEGSIGESKRIIELRVNVSHYEATPQEKNRHQNTVVSGRVALFTSTDGTTTIYSAVRAPAGRPSRDLTTNPFTSEEEILAAAAAGEVVTNDEGFSADCPITKAEPGDIVVDLNPDAFELCSRTS